MSEYDKEPLSRVEEILDETSSGTEYDKEPLSRVEFRLKEVMAKIDGLVPDATVYKAGGSVTFANLPSPSKSTLGYVYDVSDAFTTTSDFKEGSGKKYPAGTNVAIVDIGTDENPIYKYDVLSGFIDMDNYVEKEAGKGLSSNDFTDAAKNKLDELENYDDTEIKNDISNISDAVEDKVDKVAGKGLSTNDFTDAAKNKLDDLENYDDTEIKNDISALSDTVADKVDKVNGKSLSTNDYTDADKALVQNSPITVTATASPISTANGKPRKLTIYGKSEVVDGAINSAGEGWSVVRLADLTWQLYQNRFFATNLRNTISPFVSPNTIPNILSNKYVTMSMNGLAVTNKSISVDNGNDVEIKDLDYTTVSDFVASLGDATLCYELADPTQGNAIAVKTDNGTGVDGTMATFTTGTPLYDISDTVRDAMNWDGTSGEVTKNCGEVDLSTFLWYRNDDFTAFFSPSLNDIIKTGFTNSTPAPMICGKYVTTAFYTAEKGYFEGENKAIAYAYKSGEQLYIKDTDYTDATDFKNSLSNVKLVYELATPTTTPLTTTEIASFAGLKTYSPQTTITINDNPDYSIEAYANTANGQAISDMQPTRSPLLTLTASGWTNNTQTVTFAHDTGKRNSIDVEPASIKAWTAAGILATAETASTITFECDTAPTADLSFRVTSMEVR